MRRLLSLAALLLSIDPTEAEVVDDLAKCSDFFLFGTPPEIQGILEDGKILAQNRYKPICQTLDDMRTFVTLYDTANKIPVFSAYRYHRTDPNICRPKLKNNPRNKKQRNKKQRNKRKRNKRKRNKRKRNYQWKIEPQLEDIKNNINMKPSHHTMRHQAGNSNYSGCGNLGYSRGHLLPSSYGKTKHEKMSTFTLTNIVPQREKFNQGSWQKMEECVKCLLDEYCIDNNGQTEVLLVLSQIPFSQIPPSFVLVLHRWRKPAFIHCCTSCVDLNENNQLCHRLSRCVTVRLFRKHFGFLRAVT
ncbi:endonuclease domain-containing 1 protein-like [Solea senegalensis]|uniref:Endonuclease domain-containing 1 protein-like n=1 Tax=Solea senegalensis TaxID=28829 RepID=A0AAV6QU88_SOLSE|nr:endonuclease domain-containing 1 protein-like [Solea senegalensis]